MQNWCYARGVGVASKFVAYGHWPSCCMRWVVTRTVVMSHTADTVSALTQDREDFRACYNSLSLPICCLFIRHYQVRAKMPPKNNDTTKKRKKRNLWLTVGSFPKISTVSDENLGENECTSIRWNCAARQKNGESVLWGAATIWGRHKAWNRIIFPN